MTFMLTIACNPLVVIIKRACIKPYSIDEANAISSVSSSSESIGIIQ